MLAFFDAQTSVTLGHEPENQSRQTSRPRVCASPTRKSKEALSRLAFPLESRFYRGTRGAQKQRTLQREKAGRKPDVGTVQRSCALLRTRRNGDALHMSCLLAQPGTPEISTHVLLACLPRCS
jgi:hypothetical protein